MCDVQPSLTLSKLRPKQATSRSVEGFWHHCWCVAAQAESWRERGLCHTGSCSLCTPLTCSDLLPLCENPFRTQSTSTTWTPRSGPGSLWRRSCQRVGATAMSKSESKSQQIVQQLKFHSAATSCSAPFYKIMVPTVDTVRYHFLVKALVLSQYPVLLTGPVGTGKTSVAQSVLGGLTDRWTGLTINMSSQVGSNTNLSSDPEQTQDSQLLHPPPRPLLAISRPSSRVVWRREPRGNLCRQVGSVCCASWMTSTCRRLTSLALNPHWSCCASGLTTASGMTTRNRPRNLSR